MEDNFSTHYDILESLADAVSVRPWQNENDIRSFVQCQIDLGSASENDEQLYMSVALALNVAVGVFAENVSPEDAGHWIDVFRSASGLTDQSSTDEVADARDLAIFLVCSRLTGSGNMPDLQMMLRWIDRCFPVDDDTLDESAACKVISGLASVFGLVVTALSPELRLQFQGEIREIAGILRTAQVEGLGDEFPEAA